MASKFVFFIVTVFAAVTLIECYPAFDERDPQIMCHLPPVRGLCRALIPRWTYDAKSGRCIEFKFGGCAGNANNFATERDCFAACSGIRRK